MKSATAKPVTEAKAYKTPIKIWIPFFSDRISAEDRQALKPFLSIFFLVTALFVIVFAKMEERRLGYSILKQTREQRVLADEKRTRELSLAKMMRPQHVERFAQDRLTLRKVQNSQIIQLNGGMSGSAGAIATSEREL